MSLEERYRRVVDRIGGRARLVAVGKAATIADVRTVYALGQRDFAENRADALALRVEQMPPDVQWHFIGAIQSKKVRVLRELRPLVHSFDRLDLLDRWGSAPFLLQVDFSGAAKRSGIAPAELASAIEAVRARGLEPQGLSTLPPQDGDPRPWFRELRRLRDEHGLKELSMGMSADFEAAIEEGATMVRVGRAIFG